MVGRLIDRPVDAFPMVHSLFFVRSTHQNSITAARQPEMKPHVGTPDAGREVQQANHRHPPARIMLNAS